MKRKWLAVLVAMMMVVGLMGGVAAGSDEVEEFPLFAGQDSEVGTVNVWNDDENLYVEYELDEDVTDEGWEITETHLHVVEEFDAFPTTPGRWDNPIPGQFNYSSETEYVIPLNDDWESDAELKIAAHAAIARWVEGEELVKNGGFDEPVVDHDAGWDIFTSDEVSGWTAEWVEGPDEFEGFERPEDAYIELHGEGDEIPAGWTAYEGDQYTELDSDWDDPDGDVTGEPASVSIWQKLDTSPDNKYALSFAFSPRPGHDDNAMLVEWGDKEVADLSVDGSGLDETDWDFYEYDLTAEDELTTLQFTDTSECDSYGTFLDAVSVLEWYEETETAWAAEEEGEIRFTEQGSWATYFEYTVAEVPEPSLIENYEIIESTHQSYSPEGWAGWSVSEGNVVLGGGFSNQGPVSTSAPADEGSEWPHYDFDEDEYGWVVQNDGTAGEGYVYAIEAEMPEGYEIITQTITGFSSEGWGGWSAPEGKVVLGGGFDADGRVSTSAPAGPETVWPHYTFGEDEYGWVVQSAGATEITICLVVADKPDGYEIVKSDEQSYSATGWAGWSVDDGRVVLGGGFDNTSPVRASYPAGPGTETPFGYTYDEYDEYGWLVQSHEPGGSGHIYVIYAEAAE